MYLYIAEFQLFQSPSNATMPHEVACVDISPLGGQEDGKASFCAIGLWTEISVSLLKLPSLQQVDNQLLGGGTYIMCVHPTSIPTRWIG